MSVKAACSFFLYSTVIMAFLFHLSPSALSRETGPAVGTFAPELNPAHWLQKHENHPTAMGQLAGKVVLVHTFAYHCDP